MMKPKEIRRQARISLEGNYFFAVNLTISLTLFTMALTLLLQSSNLAVSARSFDQALFWILTVIVTILSALLSVGLIRFLYSLCLKKPVVQPGMLFYAFRMQPDTFILTFVFRYLVSYIWFAPALYFYLQLPLAVDPTAIPPELPALLARVAACGLAAVIPAVLCSLPWCLTVFVLLDDPDCSPAEALRTSRILMQGQYLRVLRLWLGFLPLYLLSLTSMGIGLLWVRPYFYVSMGHLYLELRGDRAEVC